jgi:3-oxoacyl-[acyl-carrier protein] reductase
VPADDLGQLDEESLMYDLNGRVALITGANGAIGKAAAEIFWTSGCKLVLSDMALGEAERLASSLDPEQGGIAVTSLDSENSSDARAAVELCMEKFGRLDYLVAAAGIYEEQRFADMTDEQWRRTMAINLDGVFYVSREAVKVMGEGSSIVLIASDAAHQGATPRHAHYGASKAGVVGLVRSLARELAPKIRINAISPGTIDTPMVAELMKGWGDALLSTTPMQRLGRPEEVGHLAAFLCSPGSSYITGQAIHPNGGSYIGG